MKMPWRKVGSKLILNTPKVNDKNQKVEHEIFFGLTHHSTKQYLQMLPKFFYDWSTHIFQSLADCIKFLTEKVKVSYSCMQNLSKIYKGPNSKITSTPCNQLTLCNCRVKEEFPIDGKCQTTGAVYEFRATSPE